jgi:hypothetical protein
MTEESLAAFNEQLTMYAQQKHLSPQTLARWQAWAEADQTALWEVVQELQLGENHLRDVIDWCEEIALRDDGTIAGLWARPEMQRPLTSKLGRNDKLKAVKETLRKIRYPHLSRLEEDLQAAIKALDLGRRVQVSFPPSLEGDEMTVSIKARNAKELQDSVEQLRERLANGTIQQLFTLLDQV